MSRAEIETYFNTVGQWMKDDLARELKLAELSQTVEGKRRLGEMGVPLGGGNLLIALGLVAYSEALGRLRLWNSGERHRPSKDEACFNAFFNGMAKGRYRTWWADSWRGPRGKSPYDVLRSGLVHEYHPKVPSNIHIGAEMDLGLSYQDGWLVFNAKPYYDHFCAEMDVLAAQLLEQSDPEAEIPPPSGFWTLDERASWSGGHGAVASGSHFSPTQAVGSRWSAPIPISPSSDPPNKDDKVG